MPPKSASTGLDAAGTTQDLSEHLEQSETKIMPLTLETLSETTSETCSEQTTEEDEQEGLEAATEDALRPASEDGEPARGPYRGQTLMSQIDQLKHIVTENGNRLKTLRSKAIALQSEYASDSKRLAALQQQLTGFAESLPHYKLLRNRFISSFVRDKLNKATEFDIKIIGEGNPSEWALGGDMVCDAQLYGEGGRTDHTVFKQLYGFFPQIAKTLTHMETIHILNNHATVTASNYKQCSPDFSKQFERFVELFEESGFDENYLQGEQTAVTKAYRSFLHCCLFEAVRT